MLRLPVGWGGMGVASCYRAVAMCAAVGWTGLPAGESLRRITSNNGCFYSIQSFHTLTASSTSRQSQT